jgi:hypothetical protein
LYRVRLGFLIFFFLLACSGESESTQAIPKRTETPVQVSRVDAPEPVQVDVPVREKKALPAVAAGPDSREPADIDPELRDSLKWALLEYRSAFVGRDLAKLESIWKMGAVERLLIKKAWDNCEKIELTIETVSMRVDGPSAVVDFDQELNFLCPNEARTTHSTLSASLTLQDGDQWTIARIGDRQALQVRTAAPGPARIAAGSEILATSSGMNRALEALSDYETALQACDIESLSRVWIMTDLERQILQGLCFRSGKLNVTISEPQISKSDGGLSISFTHDFTKRGDSGPQQTRSRLTALFVERDDGNLAIWKIRTAE